MLTLFLSLFLSLSKLQLLPNESRSNANNKKKKKVEKKAVEFVLKPKSGIQLMFSFNCTSGREPNRQTRTIESERGEGGGKEHEGSKCRF